MNTISLLPKHSKRFRSGYPWVYTNEIEQSHSTKSIEPGELVQLTLEGKMLATGFYNRHSLIAFRCLSRNPAEPINTDFFISRLQKALELRGWFYQTPYYRLVHAEGDLLPGLIIDRFDKVFVIQINTQGMEKCKTFIIEALTKLFQPETLYFKNDSAAREMEGLPRTDPEIIGKSIDTLWVKENGIDFTVDLSSSQKTGWFFDHQLNRKEIAALSKDKHVLDYYCYSGGFSLAAALNGAKHVTAVDRSEAAIHNAKQSASKHQLDSRISFVCSEAFQDMDRRIANQEKYDIIILDPPAFVKVKKDLPAGLKGYEKLIYKGLQLVADKGIMLIASCSYHVKEGDLQEALGKALAKAGKEGRILKKLHAGPDHPIHPMLEESEYLKGFLVSMG